MGNIFTKQERPKLKQAISIEQNLELESIRSFVQKIVLDEYIQERIEKNLLESINDLKIETKHYVLSLKIKSQHRKEND